MVLADGLWTGQYHRVFSGGGIDLWIRVFTHRNFSDKPTGFSDDFSDDYNQYSPDQCARIHDYNINKWTKHYMHLYNFDELNYAIPAKVNRQYSDCMKPEMWISVVTVHSMIKCKWYDVIYVRLTVNDKHVKGVNYMNYSDKCLCGVLYEWK